MKGRDKHVSRERSVCIPSRASSGREAPPESWEASGGPPKGPGVVRRPFWRADMVKRVRMDLEALPEGRRGREALPEDSDGSGVTPWWAGSGLEDLLMGR